MIRCMQVRHHLVIDTENQQLNLVVVHSSEEEGHVTTRTHVASTDVFGSETQLRDNCVGGKEKYGGDFSATYAAPFGVMFEGKQRCVGFGA